MAPTREIEGKRMSLATEPLSKPYTHFQAKVACSWLYLYCHYCSGLFAELSSLITFLSFLFPPIEGGGNKKWRQTGDFDHRAGKRQISTQLIRTFRWKCFRKICQFVRTWYKKVQCFVLLLVLQYICFVLKLQNHFISIAVLTLNPIANANSYGTVITCPRGSYTTHEWFFFSLRSHPSSLFSLCRFMVV